MPTEDSKILLIRNVKENIEKCLIMNPDEKLYWLTNLESLPVPSLENILLIVESKNRTIDQYLAAAIANDPEGNYLTNLKEKTKKIQQQAFQTEEKHEAKNEEENLEQLLKQI